MKDDRGERTGSLIARTAALLSAGYPIAVLMERLCDAIADAFKAVVYVALPDRHDELTIVYVSNAGTRATGNAAPVSREAREAFAAATTRVETEGGDPPSASLYVPIVRDGTSIGVLGIRRAGERAFDQSDIRLVEALARYVELGLRDRRSERLPRLPLSAGPLSIAMVAIVALVLSLGVTFYATNASAELHDNAVALAHLRLHQAALGLEDYLGESVHMADSIVNVVGSVRDDRDQARTLLIELFRSIDNPSIYGIGIYFEPYRFDPHLRLFDPYVDQRNLKPGVIEFFSTSPTYDYPHLHWYADHRNEGHRVIFIRPYREDLTYISALESIYDARGFAGMVSVDSLPKVLVHSLREPLAPGDVAYVKDNTGYLIMATGALPPNNPNRNVVATPLRWSSWTLYLSSDFTAVDGKIRRMTESAAFAVAAIWAGAFLALAALARIRRQRLEALGAELKQIALRNEIAAHIDLQERLRESAYHDSLTGLPNRHALLERLALVLRADPDGRHHAVLFVDMDRFSVINDSLGHGAGDELLKAITARLEAALPPSAMLARLGGDEFVALLELHGSDDDGQALVTARNVLSRLREPFALKGNELYTTASIGVVLVDPRYRVPEEVLRDADTAMYQAKKSGRARYAVFDNGMHDRARRLLDLENDLRGALNRGEFRTYFQPIVRVSDGAMHSMEALVRWEKPNEGIISANAFIEVAEQMGILGSMDSQVLLDACHEAQALSEEFRQRVEVSVNMSAAHLTRTDMVANILQALSVSGLPASSLKLEITETAIMENAEEALRVLNELRALAVNVVVDDFGTGYSSLSYLRRLPISGLKIDQSFVKPILSDPQTAAIARAIVVLAKTLDLSVTAEGVENAEQLELLREFGVDYVQGYHFAPALDSDELRAYLRSHASG